MIWDSHAERFFAVSVLMSINGDNGISTVGGRNLFFTVMASTLGVSLAFSDVAFGVVARTSSGLMHGD